MFFGCFGAGNIYIGTYAIGGFLHLSRYLAILVACTVH